MYDKTYICYGCGVKVTEQADSSTINKPASWWRVTSCQNCVQLILTKQAAGLVRDSQGRHYANSVK